MSLSPLAFEATLLRNRMMKFWPFSARDLVLLRAYTFQGRSCILFFFRWWTRRCVRLLLQKYVSFSSSVFVGTIQCRRLLVLWHFLIHRMIFTSFNFSLSLFLCIVSPDCALLSSLVFPLVFRVRLLQRNCYPLSPEQLFHYQFSVCIIIMITHHLLICYDRG